MCLLPALLNPVTPLFPQYHFSFDLRTLDIVRNSDAICILARANVLAQENSDQNLSILQDPSEAFQSRAQSCHVVDII